MDKKKGFTMIEMLIVIGLFIILLPTIFAILSTILRQQLRMYKIVEAKRQGDAAMAFMKEKILRDGVSITSNTGSQCFDASPPNNQYTTSDGRWFRIFNESGTSYYNFYQSAGGQINYYESNLNITAALTANTVRVTNFQISCFRRSLNSPPMIQISYTVTSTDNTATISLPYKTKVRLLSSSP